MTAITLRMNAAIAGAVTRSYPGQVITQEVIDANTPPTAYGQPVKLVSGKIQPMGSTDAATLIYGITVRPFPKTDNTGTSPGYGAGTPPTSGIIDIMRVGFMGTKLALGTAARGAQAYVVTTAGGTVNIGDIVDAASPAGGGTAVAPANWYFTGAADPSGNTEISVGIAF